MQFLYDENAKQAHLTLKDRSHHYLKNVKRITVRSKLALRNLKDEILYTYEVQSIDKKQIKLVLLAEQYLAKTPKQFLRLACCIIDIKIIEKILPALNQLGLKAIAFIHCDYSQGYLQIKNARLEQILVTSCMQCGRSDLMQIEYFDTLKAFTDAYKEVYILDFQANMQRQCINYKSIQNLIIGPEGGFSKQELANFSQDAFVGLDHDLILKSEVASMIMVGKILL